MLFDSSKVVACLTAEIPEALAIYAFGSRVQATAHLESDLDLAVLTAGYVQPLKLWHLANDLAAQFNYEVDLLDLRAATTVMQYQVITTGQLLWGEALAVGLFECFILSEKTALNEARAGILADIATTGKVYAR